MSKFTKAEKNLVKSLIATLSIRLSDSDIMAEIEKQTGKSISRMSLYSIRQSIKKESYKWYQELGHGSHEYIHEFKERINEIRDLQRRHYKIIEHNPTKPSIQQTSLAELHKLNITLSNYFDVAPTIVTNPVKREKENDSSISVSQQDKEDIIV